MSEYKVVPVEPTAEMMATGGIEMGARDEDARTVWKAMIAAAPAAPAAPDVQGEPVGWVWHSYNQTNFTSGSHHKEVLEADGVKLTPVYTAPQPASDVTLLVEALAACSRASSAAEVGLIVDAALAAHRKGVEKS